MHRLETAQHLEQLDMQAPRHEALVAYSKGRLGRAEAIRLLGLRDYAELLIALGVADLSIPTGTPAEIEAQAATFVKLWRS